MTTLLRAPSREYRAGASDSRRWDNFSPRADDIVVATYSKVGSTWMQRIVDMLIHKSTAARPIMETYPWLDATFFAPVEDVLAMLEVQTHRRSIKAHLPLDSLPIYRDVRYIHVSRDGRDACFSQHNHQLGLADGFKKRLASANSASGMTKPPAPPPEDPREFFLQWLTAMEAGTGAWGMLPFLEFEMTYWRERQLPNLLLVHYNDLKADLRTEIARIAAFLDIVLPDDLLTDMAHAGSFSAMKADGGALLPTMGERLDHGHERFLNKGTNGRWKDVLTPADLARYAALVERTLTPQAAALIEHGRLVAGDPRTAGD